MSTFEESLTEEQKESIRETAMAMEISYKEALWHVENAATHKTAGLEYMAQQLEAISKKARKQLYFRTRIKSKWSALRSFLNG